MIGHQETYVAQVGWVPQPFYRFHIRAAVATVEPLALLTGHYDQFPACLIDFAELLDKGRSSLAVIIEQDGF